VKSTLLPFVLVLLQACSSSDPATPDSGPPADAALPDVAADAALPSPDITPAPDAYSKNVFTRRYVFVRTRLDQASNVTDLITLMKRAAAVGYNGVVLGTNGGQYYNLESASSQYLANFAQVRTEAKQLGLALIPYAIGQGTPSWEDKTLQEAFPVKGSRFVVSGTSATLSSDAPPVLKNPGFQSGTTGWSGDKAVISADTTTGHSGAALLFKDPASNPPHGYARAWQVFAVKPWRAYTYSAWIKTAGFSVPSEIKLIVYSESGKKLFVNRVYGLGAPAPTATSAWKQYTVHFNSLEHSSVRVYLVATSKSAMGKVWFDDVQVQEVGLRETVRRASLPVVVTDDSGAKTYKETTDYVVEDQKLSLPAGSAISSGQVLRVSWFQRANVDNWWRADAAWCNNKAFDIIKDNAKRLYQLFDKPRAFFYNIDEWRVAFWDPECIAKYNSAGDYLADVARKIEAELRALDPTLEIYVWNDMYDPYHNAIKSYYMVNGSLEGSHSGLSPQTVIMNWIPNREANQRFWGGLDPLYPKVSFEQVLADYYGSLDRIKASLAILDKLELEQVRRVSGFMFTQWSPGLTTAYKDLEGAAALIKAAGRWGSGPSF
jgi:hypothetical protein